MNTHIRMYKRELMLSEEPVCVVTHENGFIRDYVPLACLAFISSTIYHLVFYLLQRRDGRHNYTEVLDRRSVALG